MKEFYVFTTPPDATVELHHDAGRVFVSTPSAKDGRPAHRFEIEGVPHGWGARLVVTRDDYVTVEQRGVLLLEDLRGSVAEFLVDDIYLQEIRRPFDPLTRLRPRGQFLEQETGDPWTAIGTSDFQLLARFIAGEDIAPILRQRRELGFNLLRVFGMCEALFRLHPRAIPDYWDRVGEFLDTVDSYGLYIEFVIFVDAHGEHSAVRNYDGVMPSLTDQRAHWVAGLPVLRSHANVLVELVNENDQTMNVIDSSAFARPDGIIASHGSHGSQQEPVTPFWTYATFHTNDASEEQRKIGHNAWEIWNGPTITNETSRYPQVGMWAGQSLTRQQHLAFDSAAGAALLCAGATFHSLQGRRSEVFTDETIQVAQAWVLGARSVPLEFQRGRYNRPDALRRPEDLRVYQRILPDGRDWTVPIRS